MDPIALAIPLFLALMAAEVAVLHVQGRLADTWRFDDAVTSVSCGIAQQVTRVFLKGLLLVPYAFLAPYAPVRLSGPVAWIVGFLGVDLVFYGWHRWAHASRLGWATHAVHHQAETFTLATALRQSLTATFTYTPCLWALALVGVPLPVLVVCDAIDRIAQFWIHTETLRRLPWPIEAVFNTPSHHRVHHGTNDRYLDRNFGGALIVWDRLFGTFTPETEPPIYGTLPAVRTRDPLRANLAPFLALVGADPRQPPSAEPPPGGRRYVALWFLPIALLTAAALVHAGSGRVELLVLLALQAVAAGVAWGAVLEGRPAGPLEVVRLVTFPLAVGLATGSALLCGLAVGLVGVSLGPARPQGASR